MQSSSGNSEDISALLERVRSKGIELSVCGEKIRFRAPSGSMTPDLKLELELHKSGIQDSLRGPSFRHCRYPSSVGLPKYKHWLWREIQSGRLGTAYTNGPSWVTSSKKPLSTEAWRHALNELLGIHTVLRARIVEKGPAFEMFFDREVNLQVVDLSADASPDTEQTLRRTVGNLLWEPFNVDTDALFRPFVVLLPSATCVVGFVCHHFISDEWSVRVLAKDWCAAYEQQVGTATSTCTPASYQYSDYLSEMGRWCSSAGMQVRLAYWRNLLRCAPESRLPPDLVYDPSAATRLNFEWFTLDPTDVGLLRALASSLEVTAIDVLIAAKAVALHVQLDHRDVVLRSMHHGRADQALMTMVGSTENPVPLRITVEPDMAFDRLVRDVHEVSHQAYANALPWGIVANMLPEIGASDDAQAAVNLRDFGAQTEPRSRPNPTSMISEMMPLRRELPELNQTPKYYPAHNMDVQMVGTSLHGCLNYLESLYSPATIRQFLQMYLAILRLAVHGPGQSVQELRELARGRLMHA